MKKNKGFTLIFAVVVTAALLIVSFVVVNIALKQLIISNAGEESQYAFYAADAGTECAVYWDLKDSSLSPFDPSTAGTITCNGQTISTNSQTVPTLPSSTQSLVGGGGANLTSIFYLSFAKGCAIVRVTKNPGGTTSIDSRGYNTCDTSAVRRFERGVTLNLYGGSTDSTLTVSKLGTGTGTVSGNGISCDPTCTISLNNGTAVALTATPTGGSTFTGWSGGGCSGTGACNFILSTDITITATFTLPVPINVALASNGGVASASSSHSSGNYAPAGAINGDRKGQIWGSNAGWNDNTNSVFPDWLQVDFSGTKTINEIDVFSLQDNYTAPSDPTPFMTFSLYGLINFEVQYWTGSAWQDVPGGLVTSNNLVWRKFTFASISTAKIRILVTGTGDNVWSRIPEVEAYGF